MLLSTGKELVRLQGAFIDTDEHRKATEYIGSGAIPEAYKLPEYYDEESDTSKDLEDLGGCKMSRRWREWWLTSMAPSRSQRKMKIGYNRAGKDFIEPAGGCRSGGSF
ncbi:MAG: hypothetical protein U5L09_03195 [Bacteroidales bacterium]|nr:hypothetical protein [Bacteroidales bacterium]